MGESIKNKKQTVDDESLFRRIIFMKHVYNLLPRTIDSTPSLKRGGTLDLTRNWQFVHIDNNAIP